MSLRSLGYLLTRRFYPRKIYNPQAEFLPGIVSRAASAPAAGTPGRSLHSLRGLSAGANAYGPLVATALAGGLGILIFKKHQDDADKNVTDKYTKDVRSKKPEVTDNKPMPVEVTNMDMRHVDMEAMFHEWMERVGRVYQNQEEQTRRFEVFKEGLKRVEFLYGGDSSVQYLPNKFADRTHEEVIAMKGHTHRDSVPFGPDSEEYEALRRLVEEDFIKHKVKSTAAQNAVGNRHP